MITLLIILAIVSFVLFFQIGRIAERIQHHQVLTMARRQIAESKKDNQRCLDALDQASRAIDLAREQSAYIPLIESLRSSEGNSVTILCDNPDFNGLPNNAVLVCADWTGWAEERFGGSSVRDCLQRALDAKMDRREAAAINREV